MMKLGVVFPQTEIGPDAATVRAYAQAVEEVGYDHLLIYDHVLGASTRNRPDWRGPYSSDSQFHEVFVLFGYLAALTSRLELVTGVLVMPQRQTALVAKQAAEIDRLSDGRLRLGVGVGWNKVEYDGLNERFANRGRRIEEQIDLLRRLWTEPVVDFHGAYHDIDSAGINPLPVQQPIPIWIGGYADITMDRVGRLGDGWFPGTQPGPQLRESLEKIAASAEAAGRDPQSIGIEGRITLRPGEEQDWLTQTEAWRKAGATHLSVNTMGQGRSPDQHIETVVRYRQLVQGS
jgi:probable F420-dependent oxidoreductase